jgi:hypothetical protein
MRRIAKIAAFAALVLGYVWVAGVRNVDEVKQRKQLRHSLDNRG